MSNITRLFEEYGEPEREIIVGEGIRVYEAYKEYFGTQVVTEPSTATKTANAVVTKEMVQMNNRMTEMRREMEMLQREQDRMIEIKEREIGTMERLIKDKETELQHERELVRRMRENQMEDTQRMMKQKEEHYTRMIQDVKGMYEATTKQLARDKEQLTAQVERLTEGIQRMIEDGVGKRTEIMRRKISELELENRRYYELYESREKGLAFEDEIEEAMNEYNTVYAGGVWDIKHVGQLSGGGKGDFVLRHKEGRLTVLIDTKNNIPTSAVSREDVLKFISDVNEKHGLVKAGIMLARNNISNRMRFQMDDNGKKPLFYVSRFEARHVGFLFCLLDYICLKVGGGAEFDKRVYMEKLIVDYQFNKKQMGSCQELLRQLEAKQSELVNEYKIHFDEDIMIAIDNREQMKKGGGGAKKQMKANSGAGAGAVATAVETAEEEDDTSYEDKEKGRKVKGRRSKYYLIYTDEKEGDIIQYFRNNSERERKKETIMKKEAQMMDMTTE
jgi:hypothetical protein